MVLEGCYFNVLILKKKMNFWMFKILWWKILFIKLCLFSINLEIMFVNFLLWGKIWG